MLRTVVRLLHMQFTTAMHTHDVHCVFFEREATETVQWLLMRRINQLGDYVI